MTTTGNDKKRNASILLWYPASKLELFLEKYLSKGKGYRESLTFYNNPEENNLLMKTYHSRACNCNDWHLYSDSNLDCPVLDDIMVTYERGESCQSDYDLSVRGIHNKLKALNELDDEIVIIEPGREADIYTIELGFSKTEPNKVSLICGSTNKEQIFIKEHIFSELELDLDLDREEEPLWYDNFKYSSRIEVTKRALDAVFRYYSNNSQK